MEVVALLKGINVGRNKRIGMAPLRDAVAGAGFEDVETVLQSGNVLLRTDDDPQSVAARIETEIERRLGLRAAVVARTHDQLAEVVARDPFGPEVTLPKHYLVFFLDRPADPEVVAGLERQGFDADRWCAVGRELYVWCVGGILESRLLPVLQKRPVAPVATSRNWRTVTTLLAKLDDRSRARSTYG